MILKKESRVVLLVSMLVLFSFIFSSCGDDPPTKSDPIPEGISSVAGDYIKAVMGDTTDIEFIVVAVNQAPIVNSWVHFSQIIGDGTFVDDSIKTNSNGIATCKYIFDGDLGHAEIQALVRDVDTISVSVRASTIIPGANGQGQYILMDDVYSDIKNFNGLPVSIDIDPTAWILYAVYESNLGVVFVMEDTDHNEILSDSEPVLGIIVNTVYTGTTKDSIRIGSSMSDVFNVYDTATQNADNNPPPAYYYSYPAYGMTFWTPQVPFDSQTVFEIHLSETVTPAPNTVKKQYLNEKSASSAVFRRYRQ